MAGRRKRVEMAERLSCGSALLSAIVNTLRKGGKGSDASEDGKTGEDAGCGDCVRERTVLYECGGRLQRTGRQTEIKRK